MYATCVVCKSTANTVTSFINKTKGDKGGIILEKELHDKNVEEADEEEGEEKEEWKVKRRDNEETKSLHSTTAIRSKI